MNQNKTVAKFGGSSLGSSDRVKNVLEIIRMDEKRRVIVVSAPGKRSSKDTKLTDLFYAWYAKEGSIAVIREKISNRFGEIIKGLDIEFQLEEELDKIEADLDNGASEDYAASRGEYLNGKIIAEGLGFVFIDPMEFITIKKSGAYVCDELGLRKAVGDKGVVIPGFYGKRKNGKVRTFPRGGSDITGSVVAKALRASLYENWTDVPGISVADPRVVDDPLPIQFAECTEIRELGRLGAGVFHPGAMDPVFDAGIPVRILSTNEPDHLGTLITSSAPLSDPGKIITGITGRDNFVEIRIEQSEMDRKIGYVEKILRILRKLKIPFYRIPMGSDTISLIIEEDDLRGKLDAVLAQIDRKVDYDDMIIQRNLSLISVVGRNMIGRAGVSGKVFTALGDAGVNTVAATQGGNQISITIAVSSKDETRAIRAIYRAFF